MNEIRILLVEDNEGDILLTLEAFSELPAATRIDVVRDGAEALAYLRKEGKYSKTPLPQLILLDINMPGILGTDAAEILLKEMPHCRVVIFSANIQESFRERTNAMGIIFVAKPITEKSIAEALHYFLG